MTLDGSVTSCNTPKKRFKSQNRQITHLAQELREKHAFLQSWRKASIACKVLTASGKPDPGLAHRIAIQGYEPRLNETRRRIGLAPICVSCGKRVKRVRHVPEWLQEAAKSLQSLEAKNEHPMQMVRIYTRTRKRINLPPPGDI